MSSEISALQELLKTMAMGTARTAVREVGNEQVAQDAGLQQQLIQAQTQANMQEATSAVDSQIANTSEKLQAVGVDPNKAQDTRNPLEQMLNLRPNQNVIFDIFELVGRGHQALTGALTEGIENGGENLTKGLVKGLTGQERDYSWGGVIRAAMLGDSTETGAFDISDVLGMAGDIFLDPADIAFLGAGKVAKGLSKVDDIVDASRTALKGVMDTKTAVGMVDKVKGLKDAAVQAGESVESIKKLKRAAGNLNTAAAGKKTVDESITAAKAAADATEKKLRRLPLEGEKIMNRIGKSYQFVKDSDDLLSPTDLVMRGMFGTFKAAFGVTDELAAVGFTYFKGGEEFYNTTKKLITNTFNPRMVAGKLMDKATEAVGRKAVFARYAKAVLPEIQDNFQKYADATGQTVEEVEKQASTFLVNRYGKYKQTAYQVLTGNQVFPYSQEGYATLLKAIKVPADMQPQDLLKVFTDSDGVRFIDASKVEPAFFTKNKTLLRKQIKVVDPAMMIPERAAQMEALSKNKAFMEMFTYFDTQWTEVMRKASKMMDVAYENTDPGYLRNTVSQSYLDRLAEIADLKKIYGDDTAGARANNTWIGKKDVFNAKKYKASPEGANRWANAQIQKDMRDAAEEAARYFTQINTGSIPAREAFKESAGKLGKLSGTDTGRFQQVLVGATNDVTKANIDIMNKIAEDELLMLDPAQKVVSGRKSKVFTMVSEDGTITKTNASLKEILSTDDYNRFVDLKKSDPALVKKVIGDDGFAQIGATKLTQKKAVVREAADTMQDIAPRALSEKEAANVKKKLEPLVKAAKSTKRELQTLTGLKGKELDDMIHNVSKNPNTAKNSQVLDAVKKFVHARDAREAAKIRLANEARNVSEGFLTGADKTDITKLTKAEKTPLQVEEDALRKQATEARMKLKAQGWTDGDKKSINKAVLDMEADPKKFSAQTREYLSDYKIARDGATAKRAQWEGVKTAEGEVIPNVKKPITEATEAEIEQGKANAIVQELKKSGKLGEKGKSEMNALVLKYKEKPTLIKDKKLRQQVADYLTARDKAQLLRKAEGATGATKAALLKQAQDPTPIKKYRQGGIENYPDEIRNAYKAVDTQFDEMAAKWEAQGLSKDDLRTLTKQKEFDGITDPELKKDVEAFRKARRDAQMRKQVMDDMDPTGEIFKGRIDLAAENTITELPTDKKMAFYEKTTSTKAGKKGRMNVSTVEIKELQAEKNGLWKDLYDKLTETVDMSQIAEEEQKKYIRELINGKQALPEGVSKEIADEVKAYQLIANDLMPTLRKQAAIDIESNPVTYDASAAKLAPSEPIVAAEEVVQPDSAVRPDASETSMDALTRDDIAIAEENAPAYLDDIDTKEYRQKLQRLADNKVTIADDELVAAQDDVSKQLDKAEKKAKAELTNINTQIKRVKEKIAEVEEMNKKYVQADALKAKLDTLDPEMFKDMTPDKFKFESDLSGYSGKDLEIVKLTNQWKMASADYLKLRDKYADVIQGKVNYQDQLDALTGKNMATAGSFDPTIEKTGTDYTGATPNVDRAVPGSQQAAMDKLNAIQEAKQKFELNKLEPIETQLKALTTPQVPNKFAPKAADMVETKGGLKRVTTEYLQRQTDDVKLKVKDTLFNIKQRLEIVNDDAKRLKASILEGHPQPKGVSLTDHMINLSKQEDLADNVKLDLEAYRARQIERGELNRKYKKYTPVAPSKAIETPAQIAEKSIKQDVAYIKGSIKTQKDYIENIKVTLGEFEKEMTRRVGGTLEFQETYGGKIKRFLNESDPDFIKDPTQKRLVEQYQALRNEQVAADRIRNANRIQLEKLNKISSEEQAGKGFGNKIETTVTIKDVPDITAIEKAKSSLTENLHRLANSSKLSEDDATKFVDGILKGDDSVMSLLKKDAKTLEAKRQIAEEIKAYRESSKGIELLKKKILPSNAKATIDDKFLDDPEVENWMMTMDSDTARQYANFEEISIIKAKEITGDDKAAEDMVAAFRYHKYQSDAPYIDKNIARTKIPSKKEQDAFNALKKKTKEGVQLTNPEQVRMNKIFNNLFSDPSGKGASKFNKHRSKYSWIKKQADPNMTWQEYVSIAKRVQDETPTFIGKNAEEAAIKGAEKEAYDALAKDELGNAVIRPEIDEIVNAFYNAKKTKEGTEEFVYRIDQRRRQAAEYIGNLTKIQGEIDPVQLKNAIDGAPIDMLRGARAAGGKVDVFNPKGGTGAEALGDESAVFDRINKRYSDLRRADKTTTSKEVLQGGNFSKKYMEKMIQNGSDGGKDIFYDVEKLRQKGLMTAEEFDSFIDDMVEYEQLYKQSHPEAADFQWAQYRKLHNMTPERPTYVKRMGGKPSVEKITPTPTAPVKGMDAMAPKAATQAAPEIAPVVEEAFDKDAFLKRFGTKDIQGTNLMDDLPIQKFETDEEIADLKELLLDNGMSAEAVEKLDMKGVNELYTNLQRKVYASVKDVHTRAGEVLTNIGKLPVFDEQASHSVADYMKVFSQEAKVAKMYQSFFAEKSLGGVDLTDENSLIRWIPRTEKVNEPAKGFIQRSLRPGEIPDNYAVVKNIDSMLAKMEQSNMLTQDPSMARAIKTIRNQIDTLSSEAGDIVMERNVANLLSIDYRKASGEMMKAIDRANELFKRNKLLSPAFNLRNFIGVYSNGVLSGIPPIKFLERLAEADHVFKEGGALFDTMAKIGEDEFAKRGLNTAENMRLLDTFEGFLRSGFDAPKTLKEALAEGTLEGTAAELQDMTGFMGDALDKKIRSTKVGGAIDTVSLTNGWGNSTMDSYGRMAVYLHAVDDLKTGGKYMANLGMDTPAQAVRLSMFDPNDLSQNERLIKKVIPFYTFSKMNLAYHFQNMPNNAVYYHRLQKAIDSSWDLAGVDRENVPNFKIEQMYIPIPGMTKDGKYFAIKASLPMSDLGEALGNPLKRVASALSPVVRAPIELATGSTAFSGKPIENYAGERSTTMPFMTKKQEYLMSQTGVDVPLKSAVGAGMLLGGDIKGGLAQLTGMGSTGDITKEKLANSYDKLDALQAKVKVLKSQGIILPEITAKVKAQLTVNENPKLKEANLALDRLLGFGK